MKTLKEAAKEYIKTQTGFIYEKEEGFIAGATYQHEATIEKVVKAIRSKAGGFDIYDNLITAIKEIKV